MIIVLAVILVISTLFYFWIDLNRRRDKLRWTKRVPGLPFIGSVSQFRDPTEILNEVMKNIEKYGKLHSMELGSQSFLVIADYEFLEFVLSSPSLITKSMQYQFLGNWLNDGLLISTGKKWKSRRRILTPGFHFSILEQFIDVFNSAGDILVKKINEKQENEFDIYPYINLCALDIICEGIMGVSINAQENEESEYVKAVREVSRIVINRGFSALKSYDLLYPLFKDYYVEKRCVKILHNYSDAVIKARRTKLAQEMKEPINSNDDGIKKKSPFLDLLLQSTIDGKPLSDADIREEVDTFMFEGHDTTSSGTSFTLYCLANHLDVQQRVYEEQKEIFGDQTNPEVSLSDLQNMKFLDQVIKESLRLYPSVPLIGRMITQDITMKDGNILPEGLTLAMFPYAIHRDSEIFPNPETFDPDRFEKMNGKFPYAYIPFSAGPRNCIGQKFAMLEMKSIVSKIVRNFEILPTNPRHEAILNLETILKSKNGFKLKMKRRENMT